MLQQQQRVTNKSKIRGQGMTEYIIIVALIAVAAIGVYSLFGDVVKKQTGAMAAGLAGDNKNSVSWNEKAAKKTEAEKAKVENTKGLDDFAKDNELKSSK